MIKVITFILLCLGGLFLIFLCYGILIRPFLEKDPIVNDTWITNVGVIYRLGGPRGSTPHLYYILDNERYECNVNFNALGLVKGDKFKLKYNPNNPNEVDVHSWEPVFLKEEHVINSVANVDKILHFKWWGKGPKYAVRFSYLNEQGQSFTREQDLPLNFEELYPNLKEDKKYHVSYWDYNNQRGIIDLTKPIN